MSNHPPRRVVIETLRASWLRVRSGAYRVRRGPVNWAAWPFDRWPRGVSIEFDGEHFLRPDGLRDSQVVMEVYARLPEVPADAEMPELDDDLLDEIRSDAREVLRQLIVAVNDDGDATALKVGSKDAEIVDVWDLGLGVQGALVVVDVTY